MWECLTIAKWNHLFTWRLLRIDCTKGNWLQQYKSLMYCSASVRNYVHLYSSSLLSKVRTYLDRTKIVFSEEIFFKLQFIRKIEIFSAQLLKTMIFITQYVSMSADEFLPMSTNEPIKYVIKTAALEDAVVNASRTYVYIWSTRETTRASGFVLYLEVSCSNWVDPHIDVK